MTRIYFFKSNGLTKKDQVKMTKVGTNMLSDTAKRRQKDGKKTATSDKVIIRTSLGHFLRYVAMIFAVLALSIANIGMAWGTDYSSTPLVSLDFSSSLPTVSGVTYHGATYSSGKISWSGNYSNGTRDVQITFTTTGSKFKVVLGHITSGSSMTFKYRLDSGSDQNWTLDKTKTSDEIEISASAGSHTIALGPAGTSTRTVVTSIAIYDEASGSTWYVKGGWNNWGATTNLTGEGTTLTATATLSGNTQYEFKVHNTSGDWHTNTGTIKGSVTNWDFSTTGGNNNNCHIRTSCTGTYTFTYNTNTNKLSVTYPESHKVYFTKDGASWSKVYAYCYNDGTWKNADWPGVEITSNTEDHCGTEYYAYTNGYTYIIFNNGNNGVGNQTDDITVAGYEGKHAVGAAATGWSAYPTYTVTYNKNGDGAGGAGSVTGSVPTDSNSPYACGSTVTVLGNTGSLALDGYTFAGWNTAPGGGGTSYAAAATFTISANTTLYAQWEEAATCSGDPTALVSGTLYQVSDMASACLGEVTSTGQYFYGLSSNGKFYINGTTNSNNASTGTVEIKTASNTIDKVNFTGIAWFKGAGTNTCRSIKFVVPSAGTLTIYGKTSSGNGNVVIKTESSGNTTVIANSVNTYASGSTTVSAGTYYVLSDGASAAIVGLKFVEESCSATQPGAISKGTLSACTLRLTAGGSPAANNTWYWQSSADGTDKTESGATKDVTTTGTYYIRSYCTTGSGCWSDARTVTVSASDLTPAAPTALAKSAETAKGATLTITDGANTNDYDFYVSTNSSAPGDGTSASYTSTNKSITITDKVAGTTYYAWARAKCGSNKSAWTALTGNTFTTSTVTVTHTLTNVSKTSGEATAGGSDYTAVYAADAEYSMPTPTVTIGGNAATSGTHYTWSVDGSVGTITIPANKINGNIVITLNSVPSAPSSAVISGTYHYFPGENISLTVTPSGNNGPTTYQWYKGGKADGNRIDGATSATYTKNSCTFDDAGSYYCKVTCNATSIWAVTNSHENYDVKILRLYVKGSKGGQDYGNVDFVKVNSTTATASISLGSNWTYGFNIADGCGHYYGNSGTMQYNSYGPWVTNQNGVDCGLTTTNAATYVFTINYSNLEMIETTVTFPSGNQTSGKVIYFDNNDLQWENVYYRIGKNDHVQSAAMTKVYGTANLYQYTTPTYDNFAGWHITNAAGTTGFYSVYNTKNGTAITAATAFEGAAVTQAAVTVTPTASHATGETSDNNNCEFYTYGITTGMKTQNVEISPYTNGTITVNYTNTSNVASTLTSGNADLAHSVILTSITAVPNTGYDASAITINGGAYSANYVVTGATTIAASFTLHNYNVTYSNPGNGNNYTIKVADGSATSASKTATMGQTITIVASPAAGYDFTGWTITKAGGAGTVTPADASATTTTFTMPTSDVTITASFTLKTYMVNFAASPAGYGSVSPTSIASVNHGSTVSIASNVLTLKGTNVTATPTAAGADYTYAFSGWSVSNGAAITESQTITANFTRTANQYSVTHSLTNMTTGSGATGANAATYGTDYTATLNANSGYSRPASITVTAGATDITANCTWNQSTGAVTIPGSYITGNITITAAAVLVYTVTFDSNGGSAVSPISQASTGASITMPAAPTYADHTFQGWVIGGNTYAAGASYTPTANVTAYALWRADCSAGGGSTTLFNVDFTDETTEEISTANSGATFVAKTYDGYNMSFGVKSGKAIDITNGTGVNFKSNNFDSYQCLAIPLTLTKDNEVTAVVTLHSSGTLKYKWVSGSLPATPSVSSPSTYSPSSATNTLTYTPSSAGNYVLYLGRSGSGNGSQYIESIVITQEGGGGGTCYYVTYDGNGAESGSISDATAYASGANVTVLGNTGGNAFTKAGYEFTGWNTLANGTGTPYAAGGTISSISGNVTLFAQWGSPCSDPDDPTGLAVGSITSSGATFTITDDANTNNYEIVCKTTSGTPAADATPTQTGTSKTIAVTGLNAYTDYYAYVRSVCNAAHKSNWVALTGAPFKTLCEDPTTAFANGDYTIGGSALDLRTLISGNNSSGAITYSVTNAGGTGATIAGDGYSFSATIPGTANVRASQAANGGHCAVVLDATVTVAAASTCVTITNFETTKHNKSNNNKPDGQNYYLYGYKTTVDSEHAVTLTTTSSNNYGQSSGTVIRVDNSSTLRIYANNATSETPTTFSDVTSVSFKADLYNSGSTVRTTSYTIKVGSTTVGSGEITGKHSDGFFEISTGTFATKDGYIDIILGSGNSNNNLYIDDIEICTSALTPCTTPVIPSLSDQTVCPGSDIAAWDATVSNAAAISAAGESVAYSWKKKGSDTELVNTASLDLGSSATEGQSGTYVVTVTVSADGKASASASKEVTLTVTPATETPSITASKAKVYATDEVTLTATCGSTGVTWNWYLCANADGTGAGSSLGTSATYTIASAPAAGTYYYKAVATGDGTNSCGAAEYVYTLVVSTADACDKEFWFAKEGDRPTGAASATHITGCPSGSSSASYTASVDGTNYTLTGSTGQKTGNVTIVVPADNTGTLYVVVQGSSSRTITLSKGGTQIGQETPENSTWGVFTFDNLDAGTYTLVSSGNISWAMMALKLCPTVACTDDTPTAAATNATVCAGGTITITATGYETGATFQWQKQNASTSVWENIDNATSDTYTVTTAAAEHAGNYHIVATKGCSRTSNTVTIAVPSAPVFNSFTTTRRIMETQALSISDVSATDAVSYTWYKSADATWDAGDTEIGTSKNLLKPYAGETAGSTYYVFCRATNSCGATTSSAITVNVLTLVEEDCAIVGNSGEHNTFAKTGNVSSGTYGSITELHTNSNNKYIYYTAESGYYFATAKVNACVGNASDLPTAAYSYSTDGGANWTDQNLTGMTAAYADHVINLPANVNAFRVGRRLGDCGTSSNTIYIHEVCFTYNENCTKTTVDPSSSTVSYTIGDSFTEPTFTVKHNNVAFDPQPTITYTSSDETVATVDDDGTVNFQDKAGTVVITAAYAGDATYCESEGSYTITVSCSDEAPRIIAAEGTNLGGCNDNITLEAKKQDGTTNFSDGTYQWYRDGEAISGATSRTYTVSLTGVYSVEHISVGGCVSPSSNKATVTSESAEPEVERLTPFQYYHVDKVYAETSIMRFRHLFAVKNAGTTLEGKHFKMELSRNGGSPTDVTTSNAFVMSADTVLLDMNKLYNKYDLNDELVLTCSAVDCEGNVSSIYKNTITIYVIDETPTLALICSGADGDGTRDTKKLVVGGDFLTGYNKADLCVQTGKTSFDKTQEWVLYTRLKENYIVTPVNGYAEFNKLNYEPFDILFLTDYPKASKSDAAATILDDMADLCDYRPLFTFKTHMVHKSPSKWAAKGFMAQPEVPKQSRLRLNIVCYAHPMFDDLKEVSDQIQKDASDHSQIVYTMLTGPGHESSKGMQGFPIDAAEGFVTIGLVHYDATAADDTPSEGYVTWTPESDDVMLVAAAERQVNLEARMILFSINCGAQSKLTETGQQVVLKSLEYLLSDATITPVADCSFTFTNGAGNDWTYEQYKAKCPACTGTIGDGKWSTAGNWGPDWILQPGKDTEVKIAAPVTVDMPHAKVRTVRILEGGSIDIPAGSGLEVGSTIRRLDGTEISPTEENDIHIGSASTGNGTLIFNNNFGDTKARVDMYSNAKADVANMSATTSTWQYIGTPHTDVASATRNYYDSWLYQYSGSGWEVIPNGGPLVPFRGYCVTHPAAPVVFDMVGTLVATTTQDIAIPAGYTVIANSWVAPIDINAITDDDMEGISDKSIYFFNTGTDADGTAGTGTEAGTYRTTPIHSASYTGDWQIPSMQGFYISTESDGTLHLDYDRHVRPTGSRSVVSNPMYAPRRAAAESGEPNVLKIFARGSRYQDKLVVLEREDFTRGYDSGWDGEAWGGGTLSPMVYVTGEGREDAVSAIPEFEGTVVAFKAGEDSEYRFEFVYSEDAEPLYLFDTENNTYTQIMTGNAYYFTTSDKSPHSRFILTRKNPQVATGVEPTSDSSLKGRAKKLLIEDKMFIMVNGMLYDATGKVVK